MSVIAGKYPNEMKGYGVVPAPAICGRINVIVPNLHIQWVGIGVESKEIELYNTRGVKRDQSMVVVWIKYVRHLSVKDLKHPWISYLKILNTTHSLFLEP